MKSAVLPLMYVLLASMSVRAQDDSSFPVPVCLQAVQIQIAHVDSRIAQTELQTIFSDRPDSKFQYLSARESIDSSVQFFRCSYETKVPTRRIHDDQFIVGLCFPIENMSAIAIDCPPTDDDCDDGQWPLVTPADEYSPNSLPNFHGTEQSFLKRVAPLSTPNLRRGNYGDQPSPLNCESRCSTAETDSPESLVSESDLPDDTPIVDSDVVQSRKRTAIYTQIDAMFLHLGGGEASVVPAPTFLVDPGAQGISLRGAQDDRFLIVPRVTVGSCAQGGTGWELSCFGRNDWQQSSVTATSSALLYSSISSEFFSGEGNFIKPFDPQSSIQFIAGVRYLHLGEHLDLLSSENSFSATSAVANDLFGGQIGSRFSYDWNHWTLVSTGKFGIYDNVSTTHESSLVTGNSSVFSQSGTSFVTDIGATAKYPITQSCSFRIGYQFLLLDGVARATTQIDRAGPLNGVNANGNCILHGPTVGLEFRF